MLAAHVNSQLLLSYDAYMPRDIMIMTVRLAILLSVLLTVPLIHFPVSRPIRDILGSLQYYVLIAVTAFYCDIKMKVYFIVCFNLVWF